MLTLGRYTLSFMSVGRQRCEHVMRNLHQVVQKRRHGFKILSVRFNAFRGCKVTPHRDSGRSITDTSFPQTDAARSHLRA